MDLFLLSSGIGFQNTNLNMEVELNTAYTNVEGFIRMVDTAFIYSGKRRRPPGSHQFHRGNERTWSGSCLLCHQTLPEHLHRCSRTTFIFTKLNIRFTDIRPGFVATDLLNDGKHYPLLMDAAKVGRHIAWSLERKQRIVVIDWRYRILVFSGNDSPLDVETAARETN